MVSRPSSTKSHDAALRTGFWRWLKSVSAILGILKSGVGIFLIAWCWRLRLGRCQGPKLSIFYIVQQLHFFKVLSKLFYSLFKGLVMQGSTCLDWHSLWCWDCGLRIEVGALGGIAGARISRGTSAVECEVSILRTTHQEREGSFWLLCSLLA